MIVHGMQRGLGGFQPSCYIVSSGSALCIPTTMMTRTRCVITIGCLLAKDISLDYEFYHESVRPALYANDSVVWKRLPSWIMG